MNEKLLACIQEWYFQQCNGDWEHQYGVRIETLDNPGWSVFIDLAGTELENRDFLTVNIERDENNWVYSRVEMKQFLGACGPQNLIELLGIFYSWVKK